MQRLGHAHGERDWIVGPTSHGEACGRRVREQRLGVFVREDDVIEGDGRLAEDLGAVSASEGLRDQMMTVRTGAGMYFTVSLRW